MNFFAKINSSLKFRIILYLGLLYLIFPKQAHAYIDPSTGSYLFQLFIAGGFGTLLFFKDFFIKLLSPIKKIFPAKKKDRDGK